MVHVITGFPAYAKFQITAVLHYNDELVVSNNSLQKTTVFKKNQLSFEVSIRSASDVNKRDWPAIGQRQSMRLFSRRKPGYQDAQRPGE